MYVLIEKGKIVAVYHPELDPEGMGQRPANAAIDFRNARYPHATLAVVLGSEPPGFSQENCNVRT